MKWLILLLQAWRAPYLYVSSEARKVGHGHDCSLLLLSLTFKINEGRSLMGGVTMCHRKLSSWEVKSWAALRRYISFVESLWLHTFSLKTFSTLLPVVFSCFFCYFSFLSFFLDFPLHIQLYFIVPLSPSLSSLSLQPSSCPYQLSSPSSFTCLHLRWSCDARGVLFSLLWT